MTRLVLSLFLGTVWIGASSPMALADPPGPTDFMSEVVEIEPALEGFEIEIVGGDSFVLLTVDEGVTVEVVGYQGEPYLRFRSDGTVEENAASPSKYLNEDRYAAGVLPAAADAAGVPDWHVVDRDGSFAWHDHRTHWMNPLDPPGLGPGDQIDEGVVPLLVEGTKIDVTVVSIWQPAPSVAPLLIGLLVGGVLGMIALLRKSLLTQITLSLATGASFVGVLAYRSVPSETQPSWSLLLFPMASLLIAAMVVFPGPLRVWAAAIRRQQTPLILLASLELVVWAFLRRDWLWRAILPTNAPFWLDRSVTAAVLVGGLGIAAAALAAAANPPDYQNTAVAEPLR